AAEATAARSGPPRIAEAQASRDVIACALESDHEDLTGSAQAADHSGSRPRYRSSSATSSSPSRGSSAAA
ncbi:MAG: hypothetical protein K0R62_4540, partial [Nonomuraea muscovyensis]|nr:hypothetical protein [Nonomuraea muscovyensis]